MTRSTILKLGVFLAAFVSLPASGQPSDQCKIATWQSCPEIMLVDAINSGPSGVGSFQFLSNQLIDLSKYRTAQFLQTLLPAGGSTDEWHYHQFDDLVVLVEGKVRVWWINRETGEKKSAVIDANMHVTQLIPRGVPHFIDLRAADKPAIALEFLLSDDVWTAKDFLTHRDHVEEPFPPILPLK